MLLDTEDLALLSIQASDQFRAVLRRVALRIRGNIRRSDVVLLQEFSGLCLVILPRTSFCGAQAVARRLAALLVDIELEWQILYGAAALVLVKRIQADQEIVVLNDDEVATGPQNVEALARVRDTLPYLAFLASYPSPRLLHLFPYELACQYRCVPVGAERGVLTLATSRMLNQEIVTHFREVTQRNIFQVRCEIGMIDDVLSYWQRTVCV